LIKVRHLRSVLLQDIYHHPLSFFFFFVGVCVLGWGVTYDWRESTSCHQVGVLDLLLQQEYGLNLNSCLINSFNGFFSKLPSLLKLLLP